MERLQYTLSDSGSSIVFDKNSHAMPMCNPAWSHMKHPNQPERYHQKDAHTDKGDNRIEQRRAHQAPAQVQALEELGKKQAANCRDKQGKTKSQPDRYRQQQRMEEEPRQAPYHDA